jgi:hypothetical protein
MCDDHGTHVTLGLKPFYEARCVLCGRRVEYRGIKPWKLRIRDIPTELISRSRARSRWWNTPTYKDGILYY